MPRNLPRARRQWGTLKFLMASTLAWGEELSHFPPHTRDTVYTTGLDEFTFGQIVYNRASLVQQLYKWLNILQVLLPDGIEHHHVVDVDSIVSSLCHQGLEALCCHRNTLWKGWKCSCIVECTMKWIDAYWFRNTLERGLKSHCYLEYTLWMVLGMECFSFLVMNSCNKLLSCYVLTKPFMKSLVALIEFREYNLLYSFQN